MNSIRFSGAVFFGHYMRVVVIVGIELSLSLFHTYTLPLISVAKPCIERHENKLYIGKDAADRYYTAAQHSQKSLALPVNGPFFQGRKRADFV